MPNWASGTHAGGPTGGFSGARFGATKRCTGHVKMPNSYVPECPTGGFGGAHNGVTKHCIGW
eukprot:8878081-Pyramimonas_sp.AAC.1